MQKLVKPVRELDAAARKKLEEVLETPVSEDQQIVLEPAEQPTGAVDPTSAEPDPLAMYHIFKGLPDEEVEDIVRAILTPVRFGNPPE